MIDEASHLRALRVTASSQRFSSWRPRWRNRLLQIDYTRTREIPLLLELWEAALPAEVSTVLDLASPQLLACHLARTHSTWHVTYANPFAPERVELERRRESLGMAGMGSLSVAAVDARNSDGFPSETFDAAVSCSVLEHIVDVQGVHGDATAMRNLARWLRPGGVLGISVPFARRAFEEFRDAPAYGESGGRPGRCFFQRFYDEPTLASRIIGPSGLQLMRIVYLGERFYHPGNSHRRLGKALAGRWTGHALGWAFPHLSRIFIERADDWRKLRKPYIACLLLRQT